MEYRKLPHGKYGEKLSVLGFGMGGIQKCPGTEIEQVIRTAVVNGINFFDLCAGGKNVYELEGLSVRGSDAGSAQTDAEEWISNSGILE